MNWRTLLPLSIRDWIDRRRLERELAALYDAYAPRERAAKTDDERHEIDAEWRSEAEWPDNELQELRTSRLQRLARKWDVEVPGYGSGKWIVSDPHTGHTYLQPPEQTRLNREISKARRESIRWWIQTVVMPTIALTGVAVGMMSLLLSWYRLNPSGPPSEQSAPAGGQAAPLDDDALAVSQFDLAEDGRRLLQGRIRRVSFLLVGGLHGDNETQTLFQSLLGDFGDGPALIVTEMSPWAASRVAAAIPDSSGIRLRGADIEAPQIASIVRELAAANPENPPLQEMLAAVKGGYRTALAPDLLQLARRLGDVKDDAPGDIPLAVLLTKTLEVETVRSQPATADLQASVRREQVMKDFFVAHYRTAAAAGVKPKVAAVFGRNHMHRGIDRRGVSTLGNFMAEFAASEGTDTFNVALFAAGGKIASGGVRDFDERGTDAAFAYLASIAQYPVTVFDMVPLRESLQRMPLATRTPLQQSLLYWADSYDAVVCYREVTPARQP